MYLSRIRLQSGAVERPELWKHLSNDYAMHKLVWSWFGDHPDRERDFLYRKDVDGAQVTLFVLSAREPKADTDVWDARTKPFAPRLAAGNQLEFSLRANPTVRRKTGEGAGKRHDIFMDAKSRTRGEPPFFPELLQVTGVEWLKRQGERSGFSAEKNAVRVDGYRNHGLRRKGTREIKLSTAEFSGYLTVRDPEAFVGMLKRGLGAGKAFGCGLMLVRRR